MANPDQSKSLGVSMLTILDRARQAGKDLDARIRKTLEDVETQRGKTLLELNKALATAINIQIYQGDVNIILPQNERDIVLFSLINYVIQSTENDFPLSLEGYTAYLMDTTESSD